MTLACIVIPLAVGCLIFIAITNQFDSLFLWIGKGLASVSFVFGLIGMALGINIVTSELGANLGAAGIVTIIGVILNLAGCIIAGIIPAT